MDTLTAPIIPGLTEGAEGPPKMQGLYEIAQLWSHNRKQTAKLLDFVTRMFTPKEPPADPLALGLQPPFGQVVPPPVGQLTGRPGEY